MPDPISPELFCRIGQQLYGQGWRQAIADALDVADRTVQRWASGSKEIPLGVRDDLIDLMVDREAEIFTRLIDELSGEDEP